MNDGLYRLARCLRKYAPETPAESARLAASKPLTIWGTGEQIRDQIAQGIEPPLWLRYWDKPGAVTLLTGEPGIGKSVLLWQYLRETQLYNPRPGGVMLYDWQAAIGKGRHRLSRMAAIPDATIVEGAVREWPEEAGVLAFDADLWLETPTPLCCAEQTGWPVIATCLALDSMPHNDAMAALHRGAWNWYELRRGQAGGEVELHALRVSGERATESVKLVIDPYVFEFHNLE